MTGVPTTATGVPGGPGTPGANGRSAITGQPLMTTPSTVPNGTVPVDPSTANPTASRNSVTTTNPNDPAQATGGGGGGGGGGRGATQTTTPLPNGLPGQAGPAGATVQPPTPTPPAAAATGGGTSRQGGGSTPGGGGSTLADCMSFWEPATHMSKSEWRSTCQRSKAGYEDLTPGKGGGTASKGGGGRTSSR